MKPATVPGFYICDDGEQQLIAVDALMWCSKREAKWDRDRAAAPAPKPRLMSFASGTTNYAPESKATDWGKT